MTKSKALLIGGTGFLGSAVAAQLAARGWELTIPTRRRERARHLLVLPTADVVEADVHDPAVLAALVAGQDAVVNLVGVLHSREGRPWGPQFEAAHVALPRKIVTACKAQGVGRLVHISALGADPAGPSGYQRSKAAGEAAVGAGAPEVGWTILRPSVVFGPGDQFVNLFARLLKVFPVLPLAGAATRFQPVYVEDVARVVACCLADPAAIGQTFELAGSRVFTLAELVAYVGRLTGHPRPVIGLPPALGMLQAALMEWLPDSPMSRDNVRSLAVDNVASGPPLPWGRVPTPLEAVAPGWLAGASPRGMLDGFRRGLSRIP